MRPLGQAGVTPVNWRRRRFSPTAYTKTRGKLLGGSLYVIACVCEYLSTAAARCWKMTMFHVLHTSRVMVVVQSPFTCSGLDISKVSRSGQAWVHLFISSKCACQICYSRLPYLGSSVESLSLNGEPFLNCGQRAQVGQVGLGGIGLVH